MQKINTILLFIGCCVMGTLTSSAQQLLPNPYDGGRPVNFVRTWDAAVPDSIEGNLNVSADVIKAKMTSIYLDGLGRPFQTVVKSGALATGSSSVDLSESNIYDAGGREQYKYLPFGSTITNGNNHVNDGLFKINPFQQDSVFNKAQFGDETYYYSKTDFDAIPLGRPLKAMMPGNNWIGSSRGLESKYLFNTIDDSVRVWKVSYVPGNFSSYSTLSSYSAGQLYKNIIIDENGKQTIEFTDNDGLLILKKAQLTAASDTGNGKGYIGWLSTYYIYDSLNLLRCIIQPKGVQLLIANSWDIAALSNSILNEQCFRYEYDQQGRMTVKKLPGAGSVWMVYDSRNRVVMAQDSVMRASHQWLYTVYENTFNRELARGLLTDNTNYANLSYHISRADTSSSYPKLSDYTCEELTRIFYDDYSWFSAYTTGLTNTIDASSNGTGNTNLLTPSNTTYPYAQAINQSSDVKEMVTGMRVKVLNSSTYLYSVNFYDDQSRLVQTKKTNITNGIDLATTQYSWNGQPLITVQKQEKADANSQTIVNVSRITYDSLWRINKIEKKIGHSQINSGALPSGWTAIVQNSYDKLGHLNKEVLAPSFNTNAGLDSLKYDYNIRGWLLGMNRSYVKDTSSVSNWFGFDLGYDKGNFSINGVSKTYSTPQYTGNIEGVIWKSNGDDQIRKYDFAYDAQNRITGADFNQFTNLNFSKLSGLDFSVTGITYDANGNLLTMNQRGWKLGNSQTIDSLLYTYANNGNRLLNVIDRKNDTTTLLGDFRSSKAYMATLSNNKTITATDYTYDGNGNMYVDNNKDIENIHYDLLNLPDSITISGKGTIKYIYDATGNKLKKTIIEGVKTTTLLYLDNTIFQNDTIQSIGYEKGRIRKTDSLVYDYMIQDHLGNTRMILTTEQRSDAYIPASLETASLDSQKVFYARLDSGRVNKSTISSYPTDNYTSPNDWVQKLSGNGIKIGSSIVLRVMAGDKFNVRVSSWYSKAGSSPGPPVSPVNALLSSLVNNIGNITSTHGGLSIAQLQDGNILNGAINNFLATQTIGSGKPKAYLNWILFDEQFNYVGNSSGFEQVGNDLEFKTHLHTDMPISKNGYLYIYVSNETPNIDVIFDNLQVTHTRGPLLEENHYYPFGLAMAAISSKALNNFPENRYKFNGGSELASKEFIDRGGLDLYETSFRSYDPQIGRFHQLDPLAEGSDSWSSYIYCLNNPVSFNDPLGLSSGGGGIEKSTPDKPKELSNVTIVGVRKKKPNNSNIAASPAFIGGQNSTKELIITVPQAAPTYNVDPKVSNYENPGSRKVPYGTIAWSTGARILARTAGTVGLLLTSSGEGPSSEPSIFDGHGNLRSNTNPHDVYMFAFTPKLGDRRTPILKYGIYDVIKSPNRAKNQIDGFRLQYGKTVTLTILTRVMGRNAALYYEQSCVSLHWITYGEMPREQIRPGPFFE